MARGPFQGTWQDNLRPTVVHAPDARVLINGESSIIGCTSCKRRFDLSRYVTAIQTDGNIDSAPGSASITLSVPRHAIDDVMSDGNCVIQPMMEVEIFSKGYFLVEGLPQYYPIFWGLVTNVSEGWSGGVHTITIQCADILKWWELCRMNINAAFTAPTPSQGRSIFGNVFFGMNPYDVIYTLANMAFGDVVVGTGSLVSFVNESRQQATFTAALGDIMGYWQSRFGKIRSNLLLYGVNGVAVRGDALAQTYAAGGATIGSPFASAAVRRANGGDDAQQAVFDPSSPEVVAFRTQFMQAGQVNFWQSEYQTKLEIANLAKDAIGFEFYMDVTGDIVFKPPFYNMDIMTNKPISWIQDIDVIDWSFETSESEVVTQIQLQGNFGGNTDYGIGEEATPYTSVVDYHLLRQYGWRPHTYNSEFMGSPLLMFYHGLDLLDRINCRRFQANITIPHRPELRLGFPIYVGPKDQIWYIAGISHNIQFGGQATTSLTLTAKRGKFIAQKGIGLLDAGKSAVPAGATSNHFPSSSALSQTAFVLDTGAAGTVPAFDVDPSKPETLTPYEPLLLRHPRTGRIVGYPNVVMVYTKPFKNLSLDQVKQMQGARKQGPALVKANKEKAQKDQERGLQAVQDTLEQTKRSELQSKYNANRWKFGLNSAGVFIYAHDIRKAIGQFALVPGRNVTTKSQGVGVQNLLSNKESAMIRPISDERGFELIGHYRYGRGVALRDSTLMLSDGTQDTKITSQVALSGDMLAALSAQSHGLTTVSTSSPNPADTIARMVPSDIQTAGTITPNTMDTSTAKFSDKTFMDTMVLGSPEQKGLHSTAEASQVSRALTLSEMTVRVGDGGSLDPQCGCFLGRSDLAFMNIGYTVKGLRPTIGDEENPQPQPAAMRFDDVQKKIDNYFFSLYESLDKDHQEFEQKLRGGSPTETEKEGVPPPPTEGNYAPPFSASGRAALGDPVALALQGESSMSDLSRKWGEFGETLRKVTRG